MKLVFIENNRPVTDSLTVAETFGKRHADVIRDIEVQISKLDEAGMSDWGIRNFAHTQYQHPQNKQWYPKIDMTEEGFAIVAMAYVTPETMKMKVKFLAEFKRMHDELNKPQFALPQTKIEALEAYLLEMKRNEALQTENLILEQRVKEYEPKISYIDTILQSKDTIAVTQIAKDYGLTGTALNIILHEEKVQYKVNGQWLLYSKHQDKGYTKSLTIDIFRTGGNRDVKLNTQWTQKGRLFIHELLSKRGVLPFMDRQSA